MKDGPRESSPLEKTAVDHPPAPKSPAAELTLVDRAVGGEGTASSAGEYARMAVTPPTAPPPPPADALDATMLEAGCPTLLTAAASARIEMRIPDAFLSRGTAGSTLRLRPVEVLRGAPSLELFLKTGSDFTLGRSTEADWITAFFPRSEKNDLRSRRLSKLHVRLAHREGRLCAHRLGSGTLAVGQREAEAGGPGLPLGERETLLLAEDYRLELRADSSLHGTMHFAQGEAWRGGPLRWGDFAFGAVRLEPLNSLPVLRLSCWLFTDVGFGGAPAGVLAAGSELAPLQGAFLTAGGCFWMLNLVDNAKLTVNGHRLARHDVVPFTNGDSIWLGAVRYRTEIG
jgi:hypothetical protein